MTRFEFFQKMLTQLDDLQVALNALLETVKEQIQDAAYEKQGYGEATLPDNLQQKVQNETGMHALKVNNRHADNEAGTDS